jgi:hypothetical protein
MYTQQLPINVPLQRVGYHQVHIVISALETQLIHHSNFILNSSIFIKHTFRMGTEHSHSQMENTHLDTHLDREKMYTLESSIPDLIAHLVK